MSYSPDTVLEKGGIVGNKEMNTTQERGVATADPGVAEKAFSNTDEANTLDLPPVDGGYKAWLFLAGCFVMETLVFGMIINFLSLHVFGLLIQYLQVSAFRLVCSRTITALTHLSREQATLLPSALSQP
jgi:hypothetical protein